MSLEDLRKEIDKVDERIISLLKRRFEIVKKLGKIKRVKGMKIYQPKREKEIFKNIDKKAKKLGIDSKQIKKIYSAILKISKEIQKQT